jgi:hypothetical protein
VAIAAALACGLPRVSVAAPESSKAAETATRRVALLPMSISGELEGHRRVALEEQLYEGFSRSNVEIVSSGDVASAAPGASECRSPDCFQRVASALKVDYLVAFEVEVDDRDFITKISVIDGESGELLLTEKETCEMCGVAEVGEVIAAGAAALTEKVDSLLTGPPVLVVETLPPGATVWIDGTRVGTTPLRKEVEPGIHRVQVARKGFEPRRVALNATRGVEETLEFELESTADRQQYMRAWGWTLFALGGAGAVVGGALLGIDERPYRQRCTGADVDAVGRCRFRYDTIAGGSAAVTLGAAAIAVGIGLLVASRKKAPRARNGARVRVAPTFATPTPIPGAQIAF